MHLHYGSGVVVFVFRCAASKKLEEDTLGQPDPKQAKTATQNSKVASRRWLRVAKREARGASRAAADGALSPPCPFWPLVLPLPCSSLSVRARRILHASHRWPHAQAQRRLQQVDVVEPILQQNGGADGTATAVAAGEQLGAAAAAAACQCESVSLGAWAAAWDAAHSCAFHCAPFAVSRVA